MRFDARKQRQIGTKAQRQYYCDRISATNRKLRHTFGRAPISSHHLGYTRCSWVPNTVANCINHRHIISTRLRVYLVPGEAASADGQEIEEG